MDAGAWGAWAGAVATAITAVVAVGIALNSNGQERQRRREEAEARRQAVVRSLLHAHQLVAMMYDGNAANPQAGLAMPALRAVTQSALADVNYALSQPFAGAELLDHALNLQTELTAVAVQCTGLQAPFINVANLDQMLAPFKADMATGKAMLERMLDPVS